MKCPGCDSVIAEGSDYCSGCGGRITGSTVDYSQIRKKASDVYEVSSLEHNASESFDRYDEHMANVNWVGFSLALVSMPVIAVMFIAGGLVEGRTDMLYVGGFFAAMSILLIVLALKFFKGEVTSQSKVRREPPPRFSRKI